jgi:hypothetical protein
MIPATPAKPYGLLRPRCSRNRLGRTGTSQVRQEGKLLPAQKESEVIFMATYQPQRRASQDFWISCPQCQKKFSIPKGWVLKYLERIGYAPQASQAGQASAEVPF